jgi:hypothetical protein
VPRLVPEGLSDALVEPLQLAWVNSEMLGRLL